LTVTLAAGRYRIERELGRGGMATVYLAHDTELDRLVAIKLLAQHLATEDEFLARFLREARLAGRLSHPNVVRVYDAGDADGRPFIVMECVRGGSLAEASSLSATRVVRLGTQACAGLQHARGGNAGVGCLRARRGSLRAADRADAVHLRLPGRPTA
jgi:serine/threonine protein kinase